MKIAYIYPHYLHLAGTERVLVDKMNYLADKEGVDVMMVTYEQGSHSFAFPLSSRVKHIDLGVRFYSLYRYNWLIRPFKWLQYSKLLKKRFNQLMDDTRPDIVITTIYHGIILMMIDKCRVIKNIVHLNNKGRYSSLESKRAIFVGRYYPQKGIPDFVRIWEIVHQRHPDWHLDMYGDGDFIEIPASEEERLQMNIHANKADPDIFERYLESSFLLVTSLYEPFGLVMPEAMSCGLPVVAFDCPSGPAQIITDGLDGFLIKNRDIELFADKVCSLIESSELRHAMGKAAIESSHRFSTDHIMAQWMSLFKELMSSSQS